MGGRRASKHVETDVNRRIVVPRWKYSTKSPLFALFGPPTTSSGAILASRDAPVVDTLLVLVVVV
jgi:hypothetical protein